MVLMVGMSVINVCPDSIYSAILPQSSTTAVRRLNGEKVLGPNNQQRKLRNFSLLYYLH